MDDKPTKRGGAAAVLVVVIALTLLPMLYVASSGPAIVCRDRGVISQETLVTIYWPVSWAIQNVPVAGRALDWYCNLWHTPKVQPAASGS